jgi:hypothetical protein
MTTTEEAEWLADWVEEEGGLSFKAAALRSLAAERDALREENARLREALSGLIYEVTHLSPQEDDGSHWCRITGQTLKKARAALGETQ